MHIYADDVQVCYSCCNYDLDRNIGYINDNLAGICRWASSNGLRLNPSKSKCIVISRIPVDTALLPRIVINNTDVEYVVSSKNLGVIFDNCLSWNRHIEVTIGQIYGMLRTLWSVQHFIPIHIRSIIAKSYLVSRLLYCCEIYTNCDSTHKAKLKVVTNDIARFVYGVKRHESISSFVNEFYGMSCDKLLDYRCLIALHKIIYTREPIYLYERLHFCQSARSNCIIPPRSKYLVSDRQFFVHTVRLWNALPLNLRNIQNISRFKTNLQHHFTSIQ